MRAIDLSSLDFREEPYRVYWNSVSMKVVHRSLLPEVRTKSGTKHSPGPKATVASYSSVGTDDDAHILLDREILSVTNGDPSLVEIGPSRITTKGFLSKDGLVFGATIAGMGHVSCFKPGTNERIWQSRSSKDGVTSVDHVAGSTLAVFGKTSVSCFASDGTEKWRRFEAAGLAPGVCHYDGVPLFCVNNGIRLMSDQPETIPIPAVTLSRILGCHRHLLFFIGENDRSLCCFDLNAKRLLWEIRVKSTAVGMEIVPAVENGIRSEVIAFASEGRLFIISLDDGRIRYGFSLRSRPIRLQRGGDVIIPTWPGTTFVIGMVDV